MFEKALKGNRSYFTWAAFLALCSLGGMYAWSVQQSGGFLLTGMGNDAPWGLYHAQVPFLMGLAASVLPVVLPAALGAGLFRGLALPASFLGVSAAVTALLFTLAGTGMPGRMLTYLLNFTPASPASWNVPLLLAYAFVLQGAAWGTLGAQRRGVEPRPLFRTLFLVALPLGIALPLAASFGFAAMAANGFWNEAILAPRLIVSGLASGMALLLVLGLVVRHATGIDFTGGDAGHLALFAALSGAASLLLLAIDALSAFQSGIVDRFLPFVWLYGTGPIMPLMWFSLLAALLGIAVLFSPGLRSSSSAVGGAASAVVLFSWLDRGAGLVIAGQVRDGFPFSYVPTLPELMLTLGIWSAGALLCTLLFKVAVAVARMQEAS